MGLVYVGITWVGAGYDVWCIVCTLLSRCTGPYSQFVFHPVTENVLPADPIVIVRSYMPGNVPAQFDTMTILQSVFKRKTSYAEQYNLVGSQ